MARQAKTLALLDAAVAVLREHHPMTVRQCYYQLVSRQVIENNRSQYQRVSDVLVDARREGIVPWDWLEDRNRRPRTVAMWHGLADYAATVRDSYRLDVWPTQPCYLEFWLEKDALSGIFEAALDPYGVTLNVGRGFDGWDSVHNAAERYRRRTVPTTVLYFGDFDPSGEDMVRSLRARLADLGATPELIKCALTLEDVQRYQLPTDFTKATDTRAAAFKEKYGDIAVELDALPIALLRAQIEAELNTRLDGKALSAVWRQEDEDREALVMLLSGGEQA